MYNSEQQSLPLTRRGSLRSLRSAPLLSTVLESTLSLTHLHPIASLELPGLEYATVQSQSVLDTRQRELGASLRSGIATISALASQSQSGITAARHPTAFRRNIPNKRYVPNFIHSRWSTSGTGEVVTCNPKSSAQLHQQHVTKS